jgi:hypothetical protein
MEEKGEGVGGKKGGERRRREREGRRGVSMRERERP